MSKKIILGLAFAAVLLFVLPACERSACPGPAGYTDRFRFFEHTHPSGHGSDPVRRHAPRMCSGKLRPRW